MKSIIRFLCFAVLCASPVLAEVTFEGFMRIGDAPRFVVSLKNEKSDWLEVGHTFKGWKIVSFDAGSVSLIVEKDGRRHTSHLRDSKVQHAASSDIKSAIRDLSGVRLGYELAARGEKKVAELVARYEEALSAFNAGKTQAPVNFARAQLEQAAEARKREILGEKQKTPNKAPEPTPGAVTPRATEGVSK
jgi:hypothetical protein